MVSLSVYATPSEANARAAQRRRNAIGVHLFGAGTPGLPGIGRHLRAQAVRDLLDTPSVAAWDFLSLALAAFAADRFVVRDGSPNGWTRVIGLDVALHDPAPWQAQVAQVADALRFLTGDVWRLSIRGGGVAPPAVRRRFHDRDAVTLFSGGLDSFLGALRLLDEGRRPFLVSQGSPKEVSPQVTLAHALGLRGHRFEGRAAEQWRPPYEGSTRSRSILFFGYGAVAATACGVPEVWVPENALIGVNPPFTRRRLGSLSTRTAHPHFLRLVNEIWAAAGVDARLVNPFRATTKGEMLAGAQHPRLAALASASYSCGKGKRINMHCGRCVPCIIRQASFHAAGIRDRTDYFDDLARSPRGDDVLAARQAVARLRVAAPREFETWLRMAGPLPDDPQERASIIDAVRRGLAEVGDLFITYGWR